MDVFESWREAITTAFVPLELTALSGHSFGGGLASRQLGDVQLSQVSGGALLVERTPLTIRRSDPGYFKVGLQVRGACAIDQDGRQTALDPGDFAVYDSARPYRLRFDSEFRMFVVMLPRTLLTITQSDMARVTARRVPRAAGLGALVSPFLSRLSRQLDTDAVTPNMHLADAVVDLLSATLVEQVGGPDVSSGMHRHALMMKVKAFVAAHLRRPDLTAATIATAHHISVRHLQRLFESEGQTVGGWIRMQRLERCRLDLADPRLTELPVSAVAARWGLVNASHFARLFKSAYGRSPREYRAQTLSGSSGLGKIDGIRSDPPRVFPER
ncbi:helix-turn-helix domain-containing protein [Actinoplanes sp. TBRC 11911]|uniref:AraC-like ligand-binding domain-containing protein n=1 Tax=Actinoplanes sp. TBRC 11911 TaxID=2729386 RepID=UPI00145F293E|nr:helix-turn-helix domain-containing protein [Actinoplanes sp. TBRC 11911]NMO55869.1 helix-turn-helix domain-containing protein [Actinoplanes sp. TBRC 11911]